jgi:hypothetical protein
MPNGFGEIRRYQYRVSTGQRGCQAVSAVIEFMDSLLQRGALTALDWE